MAIIESIEIDEVKVRIRGVFRISYSESRETVSILVKVKLSDGVVGVGEAAPFRQVTGETNTIVKNYVAEVAQKLRGLRLPDDLGKALYKIHKVSPYYPAARAALEEALLHATASSIDVDIGLMLGGRLSETLYTDYTIALPQPQILEKIVGNEGREAERFTEAVEFLVGRRSNPPTSSPIPLPEVNGFHALKVKLGTGDLGKDYKLASKIYEASGGKVKIRIDANQAWSPKEAIRLIRRLENLMGDLLELVEQPTPAHDYDSLREVREHVEVPIAGDESIKSIEELTRIASARAVDIVNIKLAKIGGPLQAVKAATVAEALHVDVMWGCMLETGYGISYAAAASMATTHNRIVDLDSPLLLHNPPGSQLIRYQRDGFGVRLELSRKPYIGS